MIYSPGNCKEQEKMTPPLTLPPWKDLGAASQWASLHGLVAGPHQEGNRGQVTEPVWSGPGWSVLQQPTAGGDVQTPNCGPLNETSYLVCETEEQGGQCGVRIAIPYPW